MPLNPGATYLVSVGTHKVPVVHVVLRYPLPPYPEKAHACELRTTDA